MKKWLKIAGIVIGLLIVAAIGFIYFQSEERPEAKEGPEAEALADRMLEAINKEAWDSLEYIHWSFMDQADYLWDRQNNLVRVQWDDYEVLMDPDRVEGVAYANGEKVKNEDELVSEAFAKFCNDGFWMNAFTKVRDPGTERGVVEKNGEKGLMVSYNSGGVTPGDSYLWWLDETGRPKSFQMWVSVIPVGGVEYSWKDWDTLYNGALIARQHKGMMDVTIKNIKAGTNLDSMGFDAGVFDYFKNGGKTSN